MTDFSAEQMFKAGLDDKSALGQAKLYSMLDEYFNIPPARAEAIMATITKELESASVEAIDRMEAALTNHEDTVVAGALDAVYLAQIATDLRETSVPILGMLHTIVKCRRV